ncbi:MAG: TetR/AcrR family transcriptional regulator [Bacteroidota bacterium]
MKEKIKVAAITLFNEKGLSSVTMRQLAEYLRISPGNLTYHFKTKGSLLEQIYLLMHEESSDYLSMQGYVTLHHYQELLRKFYLLRERYCFFFNDLVYIRNQFPEVSRMHQASNLIRFQNARKLVDYYIESGRLIVEEAPLDYDKLIHSIWMINTFWSAQQQVLDDAAYKPNQTTPIEMAWQLLFPYLTEQGREEYWQIQKYVKTEEE